ncbi:hypothetical protein N9K08_03910 [Gammaproteobacteria bacterium]|nr:hypothetical protein [Gammaproteobacteria bacterium]MDA9118109.1 hypothetical protein [Gammaproteobacteria bacterium]
MKIRIPKTLIQKQIFSFGLILFLSFFFSIALLIFSINKFDILPSVFFGDHHQIMNFAQTTTSWSREGYPNTGMLYRILGLENSINGVVILSFNICLGVFIYTLIKAPMLDLTALIILFLFLLFSSVFLQQYSKDFFVLFITISMMVFGLKNKLGLTLFLVIAFIYAIYFRLYWVLIIALFLGFNSLYFLFKVKATTKNLVFFSIIFILMLSIAFELILDLSLSHYRQIINISRIGDVNANSIILPFIPLGNFFLEWINSIITLISFGLPLPLLKVGGVQHIASFLALVLISSSFFKNLKFALLDRAGKQAVLFVFSFLIIQSIFEPDYSSFLRHLTPIIPLILEIHYIALKIKVKDVYN